MKTKILFGSSLALLSIMIFLGSCKKILNDLNSSLRILPYQTISANIDTNGYLNFNAQTILADGGSPLHNYDWSVESNPAPPSGVTIAPLTGVINRIGHSATGLSAGEYTIALKVSDGSSTATGTVTLNITNYTPGPAAVFQQYPLDFNLKDGQANKAYGTSLFAMGGTPPYYWKLDDAYQDSEELTNAGLVVDRTAGIVRGTIGSSASGKTINFKVVVTDNTGKVAIDNNVYTIKVN